jgi:hypothetical protein
MRFLITLFAVLFMVAVAEYLVAPPAGFWLIASLVILVLIAFRGSMLVAVKKGALAREAFRMR